MLNVTPSGQGLGAKVENLDISQPLTQENYKTIEGLLGKYGVLCFPKQNLTALQLRDFSSKFGTLEINVANVYQEPGLPDVMILSNKRVDGKPIGLVTRVRTGIPICPTAR